MDLQCGYTLRRLIHSSFVIDFIDKYLIMNSETPASKKKASDASEENLTVKFESLIFKEREKPEKYPFEIVSTEQIVQYMIDFIDDVNKVIEKPATITRILLNHCKWDKQKLLEKYFEDSAKLFAEARVVDRSELTANCAGDTQHPDAPSGETEDCGICCVPTAKSTMADSSCGHRFCLDCWNEYLTTKIMDDGIGQTIACAAHECDILVDDERVMKLVTDPAVKYKYQVLITNSFVECNRELRWCSTPGCEAAIKVRYHDAKPVTCKCNRTMCFACGEDWHDPLTCELLRKWMKVFHKDEANTRWISKNAKPCINCYTPIQKNGGCNSVSCKKCSHVFCWVCEKSWKLHLFHYHCSFQSKQETISSVQPTSSQQKYLFYELRFIKHRDSIKRVSALYEMVNKKMEKIMKHDMTWIEVQFMKKAVDVLCLCQQTLMYTYAFAYYLKKTNHMAILEQNQRDLEAAVFELSKYLELDIEEEDVSEIKETIVSKTNYCKRRFTVLLDHVHDGYDEDIWEFEEQDQ
ncbi:E3 ubiquitin-protein ligase ARIH1-like [Phymastichus coffea]|uniref:E3 ubiquitin-protein ligase ARIH1-like n=1 Tax=Phymastichus coffea TaxID=108790 RepID=UPI00273BEB53|nr:E3 ubiquitin-protein ligase ARIH1-like [Phymastichus coffea]